MEPALKRFGHFNGSITRNGAALGNVVSAEITYANNLDRIETIRSDGRIDGADPSIAALTGRVEVRFADQVLVNQAIAGDACELEFGYALPSGKSFTCTVHAVYLPRPRIEIAGLQGVQATFDWQAARDPWASAVCAPPPSSTTWRNTEGLGHKETRAARAKPHRSGGRTPRQHEPDPEGDHREPRALAKAADQHGPGGGAGADLARGEGDDDVGGGVERPPRRGRAQGTAAPPVPRTDRRTAG